MEETQGLSIVLTPVQLSALLQGDDISAHETLVNRLWGGAKVIGGALELIGSGALFLTPEPTMLTKAGGAVLAAHGADTVVAGARQVWAGVPEKTLTQQAGEEIAHGFGASASQCEKTGVILDVAVPLVVATLAAAVRIASIRAGRIVLAEEEAAGGHTILTHVANTEQELQARLVAQPGIPAASSFSSIKGAESVISDAVRANAAQIRGWAAAGQAQRYRIIFDAGKEVGYGVVRATGQLTKMQKVLVLFQATQQNGKLYFILTSYPIP